MYAEGEPAATMSGFGFSLLSGNRVPARLILGNSPAGDSPWSGDLLSLSFYPEALSPEEIRTAGIDPVVRYRFSEGGGQGLQWRRRPAPRPFHPSGFPCAGETGPGAAVEGLCIQSFLLEGRGGQHSRLHPSRLHTVHLDAEEWRAETPAGSVPGGPDGRGDQPPDRTSAGIPPDPGLLAYGSREQHPGDLYRGERFPGQKLSMFFVPWFAMTTRIFIRDHAS